MAQRRSTQSSVLSPQSSPILSANTLSFSYGEHRALDSATISLLPGQLVSLLGPNGSGKSTLLKLLLGSLAPSSGSVTWFDRPLNKWSPRDLARRVAYLPQSPSANPNDTVLDTLRLGRSPYLGAGEVSVRKGGAIHRCTGELGIGEIGACEIAWVPDIKD